MITEPITIDAAMDRSLRPNSWTGFIGHKPVVRALNIFQQAAQRRGEPLGHVLLDGMSGCGKTTIAGILAHEAGAKLHIVNCANLDTMEDFLSCILTLEQGDFVLMDECHAAGNQILEGCYHLIEDGRFSGMFQGRHCDVKLPGFTMVAATTRAGMLPKPFLNRFEISATIEFYPPSDLALILAQSCRTLGISASGEALDSIAARSRGTPRTANVLLKRCRDFSAIEGNGDAVLDLSEVTDCITMLGIDERGLDATDWKILNLLKASDRPLGINSIASALQLDSRTIADLREPYLCFKGYVRRLSNGRVFGKLD